MPMIRNFARINNHYNRLQAINDFDDLRQLAVSAGHGELAEKFAPPERAGWRKIDKASAQLFAALKAVEQSVQSDSPLACPHCGTLQANQHDKYCPLSITASR